MAAAVRAWPRRATLAVLAVAVLLVHGGLALLLPLPRLGDGAAERMPRRLEVAFVRELVPTAPPVVAPRVVTAPRAKRAKAVDAPAASAAAAEPAASAPDAVIAEAPPAPEPTVAEVSVDLPADAPTDVVDTNAAAASAAAAPIVAAASAAASAPAFEWPASTRLSYRLSGNYRGEVTGAAQVEWVRVGTRYQVHLDVWIGAQAAPLVGRRMTSDGELTDAGLRPRRYDEETRALFRELRRRTIVFDGERVWLPDGRSGEQWPGMQDAASQFVQLTWMFTTQPQLLQVGQRIEVPLALPTNVDRWAYDVVERVMLDTLVGPIEAFHLRPRRELRPNRDLVADVWFAPTLQYLPVRLLIRQDDATYIDLLLERLPQQAAAEDATGPPQR